MIQASLIAEEVLREDADVVRVLFNKFHSAISFKPTMATVLSAEVRQGEGATKMFVCVWGGGVARRPPPMQPDRASCQLDTC
jgi:hypothetical protein